MLLLKNRRATYDYQISQTFKAGVVLTGAEVKSLRQKSGSLTGSYVQIVDGQAVLLGAQISPYQYANNDNYDPKRTRRLLLHRREIARLDEICHQKHYTLVPLAFLLEGRHIKLEVGVGRGKQTFEKREQIKKRQWQREQKNLEKW
ncbi:SsrA-binding protein SmpB [bacterium]|nr:SsrA-binding protein SmpB [bacterium]